MKRNVEISPMKKHCFLFLLCALLPGTIVAADSSSPIGKTEAEIIAQYGEPQSTMDLGETKVLGYRDMLLEFEKGKVIKKTLPPKPPVHTAASIPSTASKSVEGTIPELGGPMELSFTSVDGQTVDLKDFEGKVVLIDFWATWCGPCVAEVPHLLKAYKKYHSEGLEVIGISLDKDKEKLLNFVRQNEIPWPQYFDGKGWNNEIAKKHDIHSIPSFWLINKKGQIISKDVRNNLESAIETTLSQ